MGDYVNIKNFFILSLVLFIAPNTIFAQDDETAEVEEIIVTATKRETNLMETRRDSGDRN